MPLTTTLLATALLIPVIISGIMGRRNIRKLQQVVNSHYGQGSALDGYFYYAATRSDTRTWTSTTVSYIIGFFVLLIISDIPIVLNDSLYHSNLMQLIEAYFINSSIITFWLLWLSTVMATDPLALRAFHVNDLPGDSKYKQVYLYNYLFPQALIFLPSLYILGGPLWISKQLGLNTDAIPPIVQLIPFILLLLSGDIFALWHERRRAILQPIEQTRWASLEPRIAAWCRLANVQFTSIQVAHDMVGRHTVRVVGMGQSPLLIISEALLRATDWRQKDALICLGIAMQQKRLARKVFQRHLWLVVIFIVWLAWLQSVQPFQHTTVNITIFLVLFIGLPILAIIILKGYPHRAYRDLDGLAMQLTGDPYALIAVQHLIAALNGFNFNRPQRFSPSAAKRIEALIKLSQSTEARAPYAADPVPAILHITVNGALISVPLNQATPPTPALD
ncbi:hypothetical protein [Ktedonobacter racemifer]|uniref:Uncharacterized protein n=1 Tax=Ktedonobacter racemifer DSM 44963 TaxID=485913 RepID=D6TYI1_KTERA|nr:hypothetical protein [Ktedonobacter racemifer]EFH83261.1 hypothetical protein Krac_4204 [Ktedonobacter racemifer DSM 44963]